MPARLLHLLLFLCLGTTDVLAAQSDVLRRAMQDELTRSMQGLRLDTMPRPYFIAYRIDESTETSVAASRGSVLRRIHSRGRLLTIELRVGDYAFDNTNFFAMPTEGDFVVMTRSGRLGEGDEIPLDDDYGALRRQLWLATDAAYKEAVQQFSRKRAARAGAGHAAALPDFTHDSVTTTVDTIAAAAASLDDVAALARHLSRALTDAPDIERSEVSVSVRTLRTVYLNSEGTSFTRAAPLVALTADATTRAPDGMPLGDTWSVRAQAFSGLPSSDSLAAALQMFVARLIRKQQAATAGVYHGPVLVSGDAAAQAFGAVVGSNLIAQRVPSSDIPAFAEMAARHGNAFLDELGARILPKFLSVSDNPTLTTYAGRFVGGFRVDDDGVRTHETRLVDHGILKTLLSTRVPVQGVPHSSGNRRADDPVASTMIVTADSGLSDAALRQRLLRLVAERGLPYGIIVRRIGGQGSLEMDNPFAFLAGMAAGAMGTRTLEVGDAVRLFADGHEEPIRGAAISDLSLSSFRDIVAASRTGTVYSESADFSELSPELPAFVRIHAALVYPSTYVVPDLLFEDLSLKAASGETPPLPVVPPPWKAGSR